MSFPLNPTNNQLTVQNDILYVYSTSTNSWRRSKNNVLDRLFLSGLYQSTSTTDGALIVLGGVGIGLNLNVGENVNIGDTLTVGGTVTLSPAGGDVFIQPSLNGTVIISPSQMGYIDNMLIGGSTPRPGYFTTLQVTDSGNASSTNSGALQIAGGVGVAKDLYVGGKIYANGADIGNTPWIYTNTNFTATGNTRLLIDTSATTLTVVLPLLPSVGDRIDFIDYSGTFGSSNMTFSRNGQKIMGEDENLIVDVDFASNYLIYTGSEHGWKIGVLF
jgi:hypothetical protein